MTRRRSSQVSGDNAALNLQEPNMILLSRTGALRSRLPVAVVLGALAFMSAGAQAADPDQITISAPNVKTVGHDEATGAPLQDVTQNASIKFDPVTLTTNSGVSLLKDSVVEAALKVCNSINISMSDDYDDQCVRDAIKSAQTQVDAAVARARSTANG
jgi:UrcA family protein